MKLLIKIASSVFVLILLFSCQPDTISKTKKSYRTSSYNSAPWIKKGESLNIKDKTMMLESAPFVFKNKLYYSGVYKDKESESLYFYVYDSVLKYLVSEVRTENSFISVIVDNDLLYVFSTNAHGGGQGNLLTVKTSTDLISFSAERVIYEAPNGQKVFNTSVAKVPSGFLMALEVCEEGQVCFKTKFLRSEDLSRWVLVANEFGVGIYTACPTLRYYDGYYYILYLSDFRSEDNRSGYWATLISRSRDLVDWEQSYQSVLTPNDGGDISKNTSDIDLIEYNGMTHLIYSNGPQVPWDYVGQAGLRQALFRGSERDFFESFF